MPAWDPNSKGGRRLMGARGRLLSGPSAAGRSITGSRFAQFRAPTRLGSVRFAPIRLCPALLDSSSQPASITFHFLPQEVASWARAPGRLAAVQVPSSATSGGPARQFAAS